MPIASPNYTNDRVAELVRACVEQLPMFDGNVRGFVTREIPAFPFVQISLKDVEPNYDAVSVFHMAWTFEFLASVMGQDEQDADQKIHAVCDAFMKMFSDNALGDRATTHTSRYHANGDFWYLSTMSKFEFFPLSEHDGLARVLRFTLEIKARVQP